MPSYYINLIGVISLLVSYKLPPVTMDAVSAIIVAGGQARLRLIIEVSRNKLISTLIEAASEQTCARPPTGGMGSSNPCRWRGERLHHHGDGGW